MNVLEEFSKKAVLLGHKAIVGRVLGFGVEFVATDPGFPSVCSVCELRESVDQGGKKDA
jgi:hypothetical protein